jgi:hypothetical protein
MNKTKFASDWKIICRNCKNEVPIDSNSCPHCGVSLSEGIDIILPILVCVDDNGDRIKRSPSTEELEYFLMLKERLDRVWPMLFEQRIRDESQRNIVAGKVHRKEEKALDGILEERLQHYLKIKGRPPCGYNNGMKWKSDWKKEYIAARGYVPPGHACYLAEKRTEERGLERLSKSKLRLRIEDALGL